MTALILVSAQLTLLAPAASADGEWKGEGPVQLGLRGAKELVTGDFNGDGIADAFIGVGRVDSYNPTGTYVAFGRGDGTFEGVNDALTASAVEAHRRGPFATGDLDGDGDIDVFSMAQPTSFYASTVVQAYLNDGDGTFTVVSSAGSTPGTSRVKPVLLDIDGDDDLDAVYHGGAGTLLQRNNGTGSFAAPVTVEGTWAPDQLAAGDFNEDGQDDIVRVQYDDMQVWRGNGTEAPVLQDSAFGTYTSPSPSTCHLGSLLVKDFDGDNNLDILGIGGTCSFLRRGLGTGAFSAVETVSGVVGQSATVGDFNDDGVLDLVTMGSNTDDYTDLRIRIRHGDGEGGFTLAQTLHAGGSEPHVVDAQGDGGDDLLYIRPPFDNDNDAAITSILERPGGGFTGVGRVSTPGDVPGTLAVADLNHDRRRDMVVGYDFGNQIRIFMALPGGGYADPVLSSSGGPVYGIVLRDFNGDAHRDIVAAATHGLKIWLGDGAGNFTASVTQNLTGWSYDVDVADVTGDGVLDVVTANMGSDYGKIVVWRGLGGGGVAAPVTHPVGTQGNFDLGDVDDDGDVDLVIDRGWTNDPETITVFVNNGTGTFARATGFTDSSTIADGNPALGDINGDGDLDLVYTDGRNVRARLGASGATFGNASVLSLPAATFKVNLADLNGDGYADFVGLNASPGMIVAHGTASGAFTRATTWAMGQASWVSDPVIADIDGDHVLDLAATDTSSGVYVVPGATPSVVNLAQPPGVSNLAGETVPTGVRLSWKNPTSDRVERIVIRRALGTDAPDWPTMGAAVHSGGGTSFTDADVVPGETYAYSVFTMDEMDNYGGPATVVVENAPAVDETPPAAVSNFKGTPGSGRVALSWANPSADFERTVVRVAQGLTPPATPSAGTAVYSGAGTAATKTGLANGTLYSFSAFALDAAGNSAPRSSVTVRTPYATALSASGPGTVLYQWPVNVGGRLYRTPSGTGVPNADLVLQKRAAGTTTWSASGASVTGSTGRVRNGVMPRVNTEYRYVYKGSTKHLASKSSAVLLKVRPEVVGRLPLFAVSQGDRAVFKVTVGPSHRGSTVVLQRKRASGGWRKVDTATLNKYSRATLRLNTQLVGSKTYRWVLPAHRDHAQGQSAAYTFTVMN